MKSPTPSEKDARLIMNRAAQLQKLTPGLSLACAVGMTQAEMAEEGSTLIFNRATELRSQIPGISLATAIGMAQNETKTDKT